ncbi:MAG: sulfotransferase [Mariniphaga sp.]
MENFFITGMFRSGTTLLARMLNTHKDIACASDPFRPFFNCFRDYIAKEIDVQVNPYDPLGSYFTDKKQYNLLKKYKFQI